MKNIINNLKNNPTSVYVSAKTGHNHQGDLEKCRLCNSTKVNIIYKGKIRHGQPGNYLPNQLIYECQDCKVQFYDNSEIDYTQSNYRELIQQNPNESTYYSGHDAEQVYNIDVIGLENLRDIKIADIGCGAGSFLDSVKGFTRDPVAVEPYVDYQNILTKKGYRVYDYTKNIDSDLVGTFDIVTAFAVIEHVEDPLSFLSDLKDITSKDGYVLISTPNTDDWLLNLLGDEYKSFYYRYVHQWYFNASSLTFISKKLGFKKIELIYKQKYDLSNLIIWLRDKKPSGNSKITNLANLNDIYSKTLEDQGLSNYLYVKLYV